MEDQMIRAIVFQKLQKTWALILSDVIFVLFKSVWLIWIRLVGRRFTTMSNFTVLFLCTNFHPGGLCKW